MIFVRTNTPARREDAKRKSAQGFSQRPLSETSSRQSLRLFAAHAHQVLLSEGVRLPFQHILQASSENLLKTFWDASPL